MVFGTDRIFQSSRHKVGIETKRPGLGFEKHTSSGSDQIQTIRPAGISSLNTIVKSVDQSREVDSEFAHARTGYIEAFRFISRTGEDDVLAHVGLHLPHVGRVSL